MSENLIWRQKIRIEKSEMPIETSTICCAKDCETLLRAIYAFDKNDLTAFEWLYAIYLDQAARVMSVLLISEGSLNCTTFDVGKVAQGALMANSKRVILGHNHPSDQVRPSRADALITEDTVNGLRLLNIELEDHIIIGETNCFSFADQGMLR